MASVLLYVNLDTFYRDVPEKSAPKYTVLRGLKEENKGEDKGQRVAGGSFRLAGRLVVQFRMTSNGLPPRAEHQTGQSAVQKWISTKNGLEMIETTLSNSKSPVA